MQIIKLVFSELSVNHGKHAAQNCIPFIKILLHTPNRKIGERFNHFRTLLPTITYLRKFIGSKAFHKSHRQSFFGLPGDFGCSQNTRKIRSMEVFPIIQFGTVMWAASNPAWIKEIFGCHISITKHQWKTHNILAFDKKRSFFFKIGFVRSQVYFRRVGLHLTKIGIDCKIKC